MAQHGTIQHNTTPPRQYPRRPHLTPPLYSRLGPNKQRNPLNSPPRASATVPDAADHPARVMSSTPVVKLERKRSGPNYDFDKATETEDWALARRGLSDPGFDPRYLFFTNGELARVLGYRRTHQHHRVQHRPANATIVSCSSLRSSLSLSRGSQRWNQALSGLAQVRSTSRAQLVTPSRRRTARGFSPVESSWAATNPS